VFNSLAAFFNNQIDTAQFGLTDSMGLNNPGGIDTSFGNFLAQRLENDSGMNIVQPAQVLNTEPVKAAEILTKINESHLVSPQNNPAPDRAVIDGSPLTKISLNSNTIRLENYVSQAADKVQTEESSQNPPLILLNSISAEIEQVREQLGQTKEKSDYFIELEIPLQSDDSSQKSTLIVPARLFNGNETEDSEANTVLAGSFIVDSFLLNDILGLNPNGASIIEHAEAGNINTMSNDSRKFNLFADNLSGIQNDDALLQAFMTSGKDAPAVNHDSVLKNSIISEDFTINELSVRSIIAQWIDSQVQVNAQNVGSDNKKGSNLSIYNSESQEITLLNNFDITQLQPYRKSDVSEDVPGIYVNGDTVADALLQLLNNIMNASGDDLVDQQDISLSKNSSVPVQLIVEALPIEQASDPIPETVKELPNNFIPLNEIAKGTPLEKLAEEVRNALAEQLARLQAATTTPAHVESPEHNVTVPKTDLTASPQTFQANLQANENSPVNAILSSEKITQGAGENTVTTDINYHTDSNSNATAQNPDKPEAFRIPLTVNIRLPEDSFSKLADGKDVIAKALNAINEAGNKSIESLLQALPKDTMADLKQIHLVLDKQNSLDGKILTSDNNKYTIDQANQGVDLHEKLWLNNEKTPGSSQAVKYTLLSEINSNEVEINKEDIVVRIPASKLQNTLASNPENQDVRLVINKDSLNSALKSSSAMPEVIAVVEGNDDEPVSLKIDRPVIEALLKSEDENIFKSDDTFTFKAVIKRDVDNLSQKQIQDSNSPQPGQKLRVRIPVQMNSVADSGDVEEIDIQSVQRKAPVLQDLSGDAKSAEKPDLSLFNEKLNNLPKSQGKININASTKESGQHTVENASENLAPDTAREFKQSLPSQMAVKLSSQENSENEHAVKGMFVLKPDESAIPKTETPLTEHSGGNFIDDDQNVGGISGRERFMGSGSNGQGKQSAENDQAAVFKMADNDFAKIHTEKVVATEHVMSMQDSEIEESRSGAARTPWHISEFADKILQNAQLIRKNGNSEMKVRLIPPHLGKMTLNLKVEDSRLIARIQVETVEAKSMIQDNLSQLRDVMTDRGMEIQSFDVDVRRDFNEQLNQPGWTGFERNQQGRPAMKEQAPGSSTMLLNELSPGERMRSFGYNTMEIVA